MINGLDTLLVAYLSRVSSLMTPHFQQLPVQLHFEESRHSAFKSPTEHY